MKKNKGQEAGKTLSVKELISIIQACEQSQVHSFELDSLKITFRPVEDAILTEAPTKTPETPSQDNQPNPIQDELDNMQLQVSDPVAWEEKYLGQSE